MHSRRILDRVRLQEQNMSAQWVTSATGLPHQGESVEFMLDGRSVAMDGTYDRQTFRSRWTGYDIQRVRTWRLMEANSAEARTPLSAIDRVAYCG
jgi:hypothetical protein